MKTLFKIITATLILPFFFSCSSNDDEKEVIADIDPTNYIIVGKLLDNRLTIMSFSSDNTVSMKNIDNDVDATYTVSGDTLKIANYGFVKIQNNAIAYAEMDLMEFDGALLIEKASQNVFKDKDFSGTLVNSNGEIPFFIRFSDSGTLQGIGISYDDANPQIEFDVINNVAGSTDNEVFSNVFYMHNNKLVYEIKVEMPGAGLQYFYNEGLELHQ